MDKQAILASLASEHRGILMLIQHFTPRDFEQIVSADWTVTDLFGHIAYWNVEAARAIEQVARDHRPVMMLDKDDDAVNAREVGKRRNLPFHVVMEEYRLSAQALTEAIRRTPDAALHRKTLYQSADGKDANAAWIAGGIVEHYQEHRAQLERALQR